MSEARDVAKLLLLAADGVERRGADATAGVMRRAARILWTLEVDRAGCVVCGVELPPYGGRGRRPTRCLEHRHARRISPIVEDPDRGRAESDDLAS